MLLPLALALLLAPTGKSEPAPYALLVGAGRYESLPESLHLDGPENDVLLVRRALIDVLDHPPENVRILSTGEGMGPSDQPTRARILEEIERVADLARAGAVSEFFVMFAGHGTQLPDQDGDELDGRDEAFLPSDVEGWDEAKGLAPGALLDDEIEALLAPIAANVERVVLVVDSCHSGTLLRGVDDDGVVWRELAPSELGVPQEAWEAPVSAARRTSDTLARGEGIVALYAARSDERAPEMHQRNLLAEDPSTRVFGAFTHAFVTELYLSGGDETFAQLLGRLRARYDAARRSTPRPTGEGRLEAPVRIAGTPPSFQALRPGREIVIQNYGALHDAVVGAVFDLFPPGEGGGDPLGAVRVVDVGIDQSTAEMVDPFEWPTGVRGVPAELAEVPITPRLLHIAYVGAAGSSDREPLRTALDEVLDAYPNRFVRAAAVEEADWIVRAAKGDRPAVVYRRELGALEGFLVDEESVGHVLSNVFRQSNLVRLTLHPEHGGLPPGIEVRIAAVGAEESGGVPMPGTPVECQARNRSDRRWYLTIHALDVNCQIDRLLLKDSGKLEPGTDWVRLNEDLLVFTDDTLGRGQLHIIALDAWRDLPDLSQDPLVRYRGAQEVEGFGRALHGLAYGGTSRGIQSTSKGDAVNARAGIIDFVTDWPVVLPLAPDGPSTTGTPAPWGDGGSPRHIAFEDTGTQLLVIDGEHGQSILLDLDGDAGEGTDPEAFDAEIVIRRRDGSVAAFYDLDGRSDDEAGAYELVLVDRNRDGRSDTVFEWSGDTWQRDDSRRLPLLQIDRLKSSVPREGWIKWRNAALDTLAQYFTVVAGPNDVVTVR